MNMTREIDATNQVLGRLASRIALLLRGKDSPKFQPHILSEEEVVVSNVDKIKFTGRKLEQKKYFHYSGYPGGIRERTMGEIFAKDPKEVLRRAVFGMLPKNRLRKEMIKHLIFK